MILKNILDEDFVNYKKPSMYIAFPYCTFKCEKDCGIQCCQNSPLARSKNIDVDCDELIKRYLANPITKAIVFCGLEPFDSFPDMLTLIDKLRKVYMCNDDVVVYTGFYKEELKEKLEVLKNYPNIIIKYGRFIPNQSKHFDEVLGVNLASDNQFAERLS